MLTYTVLLIIVSHALAGATFISNFKIEEPAKAVVSPEEPREELLDQPAEGAKYKLSYADYYSTWQKFKSTFSKKYGTIDEERRRYSIFMENVKLIEQHNWEYHNGSSSFYLDINHFADLTNEEYQTRSGFRANARNTKECDIIRPVSMNAPVSVDWRNKGYVTPAKNQIDCASCWAFTAAGAVEALWFKKTGKLLSLSEQQLLDCSDSYGNNACIGGLADYAFKYIIDSGIEEESAYPYENKQGNCRYNKSKVVANISSCKSIMPEGSEAALKVFVGNVGPVALSIDANSTKFKFYSGGIYDNPSCKSDIDDLNHGVLAVGYDTLKGQDFWIVKNSFGPDWGEKGFGLMSRNKNNQCGVASYASYPLP